MRIIAIGRLAIFIEPRPRYWRFRVDPYVTVATWIDAGPLVVRWGRD